MASAYKAAVQTNIAPLLLCLLAAACGTDDDTDLRRSGMLSPVTYDERAVRVQVAQTRFAVPSNCLDSPLEAATPTKDGAYVEDAILLAAVLPNLTCRTRENRAMFLSTGPLSARVSILIQPIRAHLEPATVFSRLFEQRAAEQSNSTRATVVSRKTDEEIYRSASRQPSRQAAIDRILYKVPDELFLTECVRYVPPMVPQCALTFFRGREEVKVTVAGGYEGQRRALKTAVSAELSRFEARAKLEARR